MACDSPISRGFEWPNIGCWSCQSCLYQLSLQCRLNIYTRRKESRIAAHLNRPAAGKNGHPSAPRAIIANFLCPFPYRSFQRTVFSKSNDSRGSSVIRRTIQSVKVSLKVQNSLCNGERRECSFEGGNILLAGDGAPK